MASPGRRVSSIAVKRMPRSRFSTSCATWCAMAGTVSRPCVNRWPQTAQYSPARAIPQLVHSLAAAAAEVASAGSRTIVPSAG